MAGDALMEYRDEAGCHVFPGGKIEPGELPGDAAKRECFEEVGVHADLHRLEIVPTRGFGGHPMHVFIARWWDTRVRAIEGQRLAWVPLVESATSDRDYVARVAQAALRETTGPVGA